MNSVAEIIGALRGWRRFGVAALAGALSVLAMAPIFATPILFVTLPILVWLLDGCRLEPDCERPLMSAALIGWAFGFGYFLASLYWVGAAFLVEAERFAWLMPFAVSLLPAGLALYYAAAALLACYLWRPGPARILGLALAFMLAEVARGALFSGFPWNALGYALATDYTLLQAASLVGVYGLTPLAVLMFSAPASLWAAPGARAAAKRTDLALPILSLALFASACAWGAWRIAEAESADVEGVRLRIVQPNIAQKDKWKPGNEAKVFGTLLRLSGGDEATGRGGLSGVSHLIWPESSVPFLLADTTEALAILADLLPAETTLIVGAARAETVYGSRGDIKSRKIFNSVFVMDHRARIQQIYDKVRLVPFGEYLPFQKYLEAIGLEQLTRLRGGFAAGRTHAALDTAGAPPFSLLVCYEIIFPHWVRGEGKAGWMLNLTNDAWFGTSSGPYQHFHQARVRAVEQGLPVVRAANTGVSGVIDGYGRVAAKLDLNAQGAFDANLPKAISPPLFARWGRVIELVVFVLLALTWAGICLLRREKDAAN